MKLRIFDFITLESLGERKINALQIGKLSFLSNTEPFKSVMENIDAIYMDNASERHCSVGNGWIASLEEDSFQEILLQGNNITLLQ